MFQKVNHSKAKKLSATLINNCKKYFWNTFSAIHNAITTLCSAFLKYEIKLKIGWEKEFTVLKCTQMRARVEKVDVLGWNKSNMRYYEWWLLQATLLVSPFFLILSFFPFLYVMILKIRAYTQQAHQGGGGLYLS